MGKVKTKSLKLSMTITFLITICINCSDVSAYNLCSKQTAAGIIEKTVFDDKFS